MDLELKETGNGGDLIKGVRDLNVINGFQNMVYLAMFGGNPGHITQVSRPDNTQDFSWWGNNLFFREDLEFQFNSLTENTLMNVSLNSSGASAIEQAVVKDLEFMKKFSDISISVSIISDDKVEISVFVNQPDNDQAKEFVFFWDSTKKELENEGTTLLLNDVALLPPINLIQVSITGTSAVISATSQSGGLENGFEWQASETADFSNIVSSGTSPSGASDPEFNFTGLESGVIHYARARASGVIPSAWSDTLEFVTDYNFGLALYFDGIDDEVTISSSLGAVTIQNEFTISLWFNFQSQEQSNRYIFRSRHGTNGALNVGVNIPSTTGFPGLTPPEPLKNTISVGYSNGQGGSFNRGFLSKVMDLDNDWHNLIFSRRIDPNDPSSYVLTLYIDGVEEITEIQVYDRFPSQLASNTFIGSERGAANTYFGGVLDEVCISEEFITGSQAMHIYNDKKGSAYFKNSSSLIAFWDFNSVGAVGAGNNTGISSNILDLSGNGHDGTMNNFAKIGVISNWVDHN